MKKKTVFILTFILALLAESASYAQYCNSQANNSDYMYISGVELGNISNTSGGNQYSDYTDINTDLLMGESCDITLTPGYSSHSYSMYWRVWIDYNQDGDFEDAGELVLDPSSPYESEFTENITVPDDAAPGETRMRVSAKYYSYGKPAPCETFNYGEVEDYSINIQGIQIEEILAEDSRECGLNSDYVDVRVVNQTNEETDIHLQSQVTFPDASTKTFSNTADK